jgi:cytochrome c oxidase assembly protein subunit 15
VWITAVFVAITVVFGILTTGSGPHAGDNSNAKALAPRNGLDPVTIQHVHSIPAYITFGLTVLLVIAAWRFADGAGKSRRLRLFVALLFLVEVAQIIVGVTQADEGLPVVLVNIHLVLAGLLVAAMTAVVLSLRTAQPSA